MQVVADSRQPGSTVDPRIYVPEMSTFVSLAAAVQPHSLHVAHTASDIGIRSDAGHALSKGVDVALPTPTHVTPTHDTPTHASVSAGPIPAHTVYPSSVGVRAPRPTLADDDSAMHQPAYTGRTVCDSVYRSAGADVCRNVNCAVAIVVGPLPCVAAFVALECA